MRRFPRFTYMRKWCEQICHIHGTHSIYTFENKSSFLYLTLSENESQFSLENISADGVRKAHCKIIRAAICRRLLRIVS